LLIRFYGVGLDDCESSFDCHFGIPPVVCAAWLNDGRAVSSLRSKNKLYLRTNFGAARRRAHPLQEAQRVGHPRVERSLIDLKEVVLF
jgi:hypothetical protein